MAPEARIDAFMGSEPKTEAPTFTEAKVNYTNPVILTPAAGATVSDPVSFSGWATPGATVELWDTQLVSFAYTATGAMDTTYTQTYWQVTVPSIPAGALVVVIGKARYNQTTDTVAAQTNAGNFSWTNRARFNGTSTCYAGVFTSVNSGSALTNEVIRYTTTAGGTEYAGLWALVFTGADTTNLTNITTDNDSGTAAMSLDITTQAANSIVIGVILSSSNMTWTLGANTTYDGMIYEDLQGSEVTLLHYTTPGATGVKTLNFTPPGWGYGSFLAMEIRPA